MENSFLRCNRSEHVLEDCGYCVRLNSSDVGPTADEKKQMQPRRRLGDFEITNAADGLVRAYCSVPTTRSRSVFVANLFHREACNSWKLRSAPAIFCVEQSSRTLAATAFEKFWVCLTWATSHEFRRKNYTILNNRVSLVCVKYCTV